jgi:predicted GNAT superfamily acetyltransferase
MKKEDFKKAKYWRQSTKDILTHYINRRNYIVYDYITSRENKIKKSYYLLKNQ